MRYADELYFAPNIRFCDVDLNGPLLAEQYHARINGFYLEPARLCVGSGHAFAAGLLLVSAIDFMAGIHHTATSLAKREVGKEFIDFTQTLPSFGLRDLASRLYYEFRNGLTHEARIKNAGEFSFDWNQTTRVAGGRLCVNPALLLVEVEAAVHDAFCQLRNDPVKRKAAADRLRVLFAAEFAMLNQLAAAV